MGKWAKNRFLAFLTKIIASHKKTCKKKLVENFERNFLKKTVFRQSEYFLSKHVIMTSLWGVLGHFLVIFQNINLFSIEKCSLVWENVSNFIKNCQKINKMHLLWQEMWFLVNFDVWYHDFSHLNQGLKSQYHQLWVEYFIRNPKTPYNVSIPGYLNLICHLRCCRCSNSQILGPKCVKISQNGLN